MFTITRLHVHYSPALAKLTVSSPISRTTSTFSNDQSCVNMYQTEIFHTTTRCAATSCKYTKNKPGRKEKQGKDINYMREDEFYPTFLNPIRSTSEPIRKSSFSIISLALSRCVSTIHTGSQQGEQSFQSQ